MSKSTVLLYVLLIWHCLCVGLDEFGSWISDEFICKEVFVNKISVFFISLSARTNLHHGHHTQCEYMRILHLIVLLVISLISLEGNPLICTESELVLVMYNCCLACQIVLATYSGKFIWNA